MSYDGMFIRQYMGQTSSAIPNNTNNWQFSPDLLVYGTAAAYTTDTFNSSDDNYESRNWYYSQAPTPGKANYIYTRAYSLSANLNSKVYLFYCDSAAILQPKNWKSDTFEVTVDGGTAVAQNFFTLNAISMSQLITSYDPIAKKGSLVTWTPATTSPSPHYYLISWIDNSGNDSNKPPFAGLSDFASEAALEDYVKQNPNMAYLDTWYNGVFLRQFPGQTNYQEGSGTETCPDLILTNTAAVADPSTYATKASYDSNKLYQAATLKMRNFVYLRGLNTTSASASARVYLYYTTSDQPSPASWKSDTFTVAGKPCNYVDINASASGISATTMPLVWQLDSVDTGANYILIAYVDDRVAPQPPDFSIFGFVNEKMIEQFVATQPRLTWLKINAQTPSAVPDMSYQFPLAITSGDNYVGLQFKNITTTGTVSLSAPGCSSTNSLIQNNMRVPAEGAAVTWPLHFPNDFNTSLVLNFWNNGGVNGNDANITALVIKPDT